MPLVVKNARSVMPDDHAPATRSIEFVLLCWPFDDLWLSRAHEHWQKYVDLEKFVACRIVLRRGVLVLQLSRHLDAIKNWLLSNRLVDLF